MRNLSRIIFINSANIPYSDDIYLDGNVHFIGTQGVGKSTLLRAILFFYNADTQRLGISVEKQNYTDYYFPYSNSYIVYEVATENDAFCILSFKSMNRVCYRFIHSPYRKEFFIDKNRVAYSESDRVRAVLDQYGIEYSRIIYTYDEYRNILYGNSTSPEFSRYSLMESKQYQNIPRTIQNVLLNSKLDAEFIKKTIISSLNEDETAIDLNSYKEHLKNFETRLKDIEEFQKRETRKQAREITLLSQQTSQLQGGLVQNCRELVTAFRKAESILPQWKEKQDRADAGKGKLMRRKQELQDESRKRSDKLQEALAVLNNELQKALGKEKDYQNKNIEEIIERSSKKEEWKNRQVGLLEEQRILTSQYMEISTKYKSLIQALDEQWNKIHEAKIKQLDTLNNMYNERLEEARKEYQRFTDSLYQEFETLSQQLHPLKTEKLSELNAMDYQIKLCRKEIFFEEEQQELKARIQNYANFHTERKNRIAQAQLTIKELTMTWEEEQQKQLKEKDLTLQKLQQEMLQLRPRIDELQAFLDNSKDTLQGWLKENKKGWEETIGKLCDESILWQRGLFPQITIEGGNSFYGISINLDSIHRPIKSIDDYIVEKENGEKRLEEITAAMQRQQTEREELQEQLKRKYQPQIKEQKAIISQIEYELEQLERQYQQDMLDLEEWKKKANEERNAKINQLENEKRKRVAELDGINSKLKNLNKEKTEKLDSLKQEWNKQQQALAAEKKTQAEVIGKEEKEEQRRISSIKTEYEADMQKELHSQGADTERLQDIANQLVQLEKELSFIKENATLVIEYQKDKRDLIDRIPGWQREHDEQKRLLQLERETLRVETSSLQEKIDLLNKEWEEAEENVRELQKNLEAYSKIPAYDCIDYDKDFDKDLIGKEYIGAWEKFNIFSLKAHNPEPTVRAYSMANYPDEGDIITLTVRIATTPFLPRPQVGFQNVPTGIASSYIFSLKPGDKVMMSGPYGDFHPNFTSGKEMIWIGGGAGMAPLRAQIMHMTKTLHTTDRELHFFYGARALGEAFFLEDFWELEKEFPNFHFHLSLDRKDPVADAQGVKYYEGFAVNCIRDTYLKDHEAPEDCEYYLCGPPMLIKTVTDYLDSLGVDPESIMYDNFG